MKNLETIKDSGEEETICYYCYEKKENCHCKMNCYFRVDKGIAGIVRELNKKGYITNGSCEGHIYLSQSGVKWKTTHTSFSISFDNSFKDVLRKHYEEENWENTLGLMWRDGTKEFKDRFFLETQSLTKMTNCYQEEIAKKQENLKKIKEMVDRLPDIRKLPKAKVIYLPQGL